MGVSFDEDQEVDAHPYDGVLEQPGEQVWSGVVVNREEPLFDLNLWLATTLPGYCVLSGERTGCRRADAALGSRSGGDPRQRGLSDVPSGSARVLRRSWSWGATATARMP